MSTSQEKPLMLMILDGWGIGQAGKQNAIEQARTPNLDHFMKTYPHTVIQAASEAVGLPPETMGNSEVGHINIGAGRTVYQSLMKINNAIATGAFYQNEVLQKGINHVKHADSTLHLLGLVSEGPVHSHMSHLFALLKLAKDQGVTKVMVHAFMDGRDTPPDSGKGYMQKLVDYMNELGIGQVATISGRYWAMDRDKNYDRVKRAYEAMVDGRGQQEQDPIEAIAKSYAKGPEYFDEFIEPVVITDSTGQPLSRIQDHDCAIFFNFRPDRAKQLAYALEMENFREFERTRRPKLLLIKMTQYAQDLNENVVFGPTALKHTLGEVLADHQLPQLRIAETEKYAHVTHFFNGATDEVFPLEERRLIASPKDVAGKYEKKPEMSAYSITSELLPLIAAKKYKVIILNFANCDMVGHTGELSAAIKAMEAVDENVGKIVEAMLEQDGTVIITADHGNAEEMLDAAGKVVTKHSTNDVPLILIGKETGHLSLSQGTLGDIAPTMLDLLSIAPPQEMTGHSLICKA